MRRFRNAAPFAAMITALLSAASFCLQVLRHLQGR
jgi:hypothetical protein